MENDDLTRLLKENLKTDRTAIERSRQAAKQLADVGIELGGYRLEPALGGKVVGSSNQASGRRRQQDLVATDPVKAPRADQR